VRPRLPLFAQAVAQRAGAVDPRVVGLIDRVGADRADLPGLRAQLFDARLEPLFGRLGLGRIVGHGAGPRLQPHTPLEHLIARRFDPAKEPVRDEPSADLVAERRVLLVAGPDRQRLLVPRGRGLLGDLCAGGGGGEDLRQVAEEQARGDVRPGRDQRHLLATPTPRRFLLDAPAGQHPRREHTQPDDETEDDDHKQPGELGGLGASEREGLLGDLSAREAALRLAVEEREDHAAAADRLGRGQQVHQRQRRREVRRRLEAVGRIGHDADAVEHDLDHDRLIEVRDAQRVAGVERGVDRFAAVDALEHRRWCKAVCLGGLFEQAWVGREQLAAIDAELIGDASQQRVGSERERLRGAAGEDECSAGVVVEAGVEPAQLRDGGRVLPREPVEQVVGRDGVGLRFGGGQVSEDRAQRALLVHLPAAQRGLRAVRGQRAQLPADLARHVKPREGHGRGGKQPLGLLAVDEIVLDHHDPGRAQLEEPLPVAPPAEVHQRDRAAQVLAREVRPVGAADGDQRAGEPLGRGQHRHHAVGPQRRDVEASALGRQRRRLARGPGDQVVPGHGERAAVFEHADQLHARRRVDASADVAVDRRGAGPRIDRPA